MFTKIGFAAALLLGFFFTALVLAGCTTQLPQPSLPQSRLPQPVPPDVIPNVLPTGESSPHGCRVSQEYPVARSVAQFLLPVHQQLTGWAGLKSMTLAAPDHSITVYGQEEGPCVNLGSDGTQHIGLTPSNDPPENTLYQSGSQYIYQYAHELGHVLSNHEEGHQSRFKWFEETLSELASLHTLRADGRQGYADRQITKYAAERVRISDFDASGRVSEWYPNAIVQLGQDSTVRELNGAIACELLPYFEDDPRLWESVTHINKWNTRNDDFRSYLANWEQRLLSKGVHSSAPEIVKAILYAEGNVREPLPVCSRLGDLAPDSEGEGDAVASSSSTDPQGALHESMEDYDREMTRERATMSSSGQGMAAGSTVPAMGTPGGAMVTVPGVPIGTTGGISRAGSGRTGKPEVGVDSDGRPSPEFEIPQDIAEASGREDQVARQIREAAEQEENPRIREALWDEYRKHMGLKSE